MCTGVDCDVRCFVVCAQVHVPMHPDLAASASATKTGNHIISQELTAFTSLQVGGAFVTCAPMTGQAVVAAAAAV